MRTGASDVRSRGFRGQRRPAARLKQTRKTRLRLAFLESEFLEPRTLLATIPAATATGAPVNLSGLSSVTTDGNANSPAVVVDPYDSQKLFAVWGVDLSQGALLPTTTAVVEGAYSNNGGASWTRLGERSPSRCSTSPPSTPTPPTDYTQVTDPSVAFDGQGNVYVLALQTSGATDGALLPDQVQFLRRHRRTRSPSPTTALSTSGLIRIRLRCGHQPGPGRRYGPEPIPPDPHANNVYIAWASIDVEPANPNPYTALGFNPNRAELVVGTPISNPSGNEESLAFSGVTTVNVGGTDGNFGPQRQFAPATGDQPE